MYKYRVNCETNKFLILKIINNDFVSRYKVRDFAEEYIVRMISSAEIVLLNVTYEAKFLDTNRRVYT